MPTIRPVTPADSSTWLSLRRALWPECTEEDHRSEIDRFIEGDAPISLEVLLAIDSSERVIGFVELSIRPYAEGCTTYHVGYLEGWYVVPEHRRRGVGRLLVEAAET